MNLNQQPDEQGEARNTGTLADLGGIEPGLEEESHSGIDFSNARGKRRVSLTNVVVAIVLVVSAGSLYLMRKQGKGAGLTFQVGQLDYRPDEKSTIDPQQERLLAELARTGGGLASQVERISKNPFQLESDDDMPVPIYDTDLDRRRRAEQRATQISSALADLQLNGILGGSVPLARIGGETVRVGDTVADLFIVEAINPELRTVKLKADGETYSLSMSEGGRPRRTGRAR